MPAAHFAKMRLEEAVMSETETDMRNDSGYHVAPAQAVRSVIVPAARTDTDLQRLAEEALLITTRSSWSDKARYLQQLFGQRLAAAITGVGDAKTVGRWIRGQEPQVAYRQRLTNAFHIAKLIELGMSKETARAWFLGMNPDLDDELPAQVIADDAAEGGKRVMRAARSFLASG
jgi:hypothetical protein